LYAREYFSRCRSVNRLLSHAAATFSGWCEQREPNPVGAPTKMWLAAAGDFSGGGGIQRDLVNGGTSHY